jgi:hypothetical protein
MKKNQKVLFNLGTELRKFFELQAFEPIIPWAKKNINFSSDVSAQRNFLDFDLYPYQVEPIKQWEDLDHIKEVVICSPEQMRLSTLRGVILEKRIAT